MKSINCNIDDSLYIFKDKSGMTWAGIIRRGVESVSMARSISELEYENKELKERIERLSRIIASFTEEK
jgi:hypothetical protein